MGNKKEHSAVLYRRRLLQGMLAVAAGGLALPLNAFGAAKGAPGPSKTLTVFYSRSGNTRALAGHLHSLTGGDIFELQTATPYPDEYRATTEQAKRELAEGYLPPLKDKIGNLAAYDVILLGSPCWWSTMAPPLWTLLTENDFSGKTLAPFMTHGGSGLGRTLDDLKKLCPASRVLDGLAVRGSSAEGARAEAAAWLRRIGLSG